MSMSLEAFALVSSASAREREHDATRREAGYKGCDCDHCESDRDTLIAAMPEILQRLKTAEAALVALTASTMEPGMRPLAPLNTAIATLTSTLLAQLDKILTPTLITEPLQVGDRFKFGDTIFTVVHKDRYPDSEVNGHALVNLDGSYEAIKGAKEYHEFNTYCGWGWALSGLTNEIAHDDPVLKRLPRLPVAAST